MVNRWLRTILPIALLLLFLGVMSSDLWLKRSLFKHDDVQGCIDRLRPSILAELWPDAAADWQQLAVAWKTVAKRVQFSAERSEIEGLTFALARLRGAILAEDKAGALIELAEAEAHWIDLGR